MPKARLCQKEKMLMNTKLNHIKDWRPLAEQADWTPAKLAKLCGVSLSTLQRHFLKHIGRTPKAWLREERQKKALKSIQSGLSVKEVAFQVGYTYPNQFSREFRKFWGYCPASRVPCPFTSLQNPSAGG